LASSDITGLCARSQFALWTRETLRSEALLRGAKSILESLERDLPRMLDVAPDSDVPADVSAAITIVEVVIRSLGGFATELEAATPRIAAEDVEEG